MPHVNNTVEPTDTFSELRAFAVERLPIQGCSSHGPACYGIRSTIDHLARVLHQRGALDDIGRGVGRILSVPRSQSLVELMLGRCFFSVFHPRVLSPLEIAALITAWSRDLSSISGPGQRTFLKIAAPLALFPPVPVEDVVTRAWLAAVAILDGDERRRLMKTIPAIHYASACVYMQLARDDDALGALAETPPQTFSVREEVFRTLRERLLDDPVVASKALRAGWVPSSARERWIRRIAGELTRDRLDPRVRGDLALELVRDLGDEESEHRSIVEAAVQRARDGLSGVAAATLVEAATRLPYARELLIDGAIAGGTRRLTDAFELSNRADPRLRARIGDAAALRVVATGSGPDALAALQRLETTPTVRQQLLTVALSHSETTSDVTFLLELLVVDDVPSERRAIIATRCVRELGAASEPWLGQLAAVLAGDLVALESVRAAAIEAAHASRSAPFVLSVLEHFMPADPPVRDELAMRAVELVAASREREQLERLLKSVAPTSPAYDAAVDQAVEWHPRHPAAGKRRDSECRAQQRVRSSEREELLRALATASPRERLRWIYQHRRDMNYWPIAWADVDDSVIEALSGVERETLAARPSHGPREWRALARRIRGT